MEHRKKLPIRVVSAITVFLFLFNNITPVSFATSNLPDQILHDLNGLDANIGKIEETYLGSGDRTAPFFIYVQDAHSNPDAQESIRQILHYLNRTFSGRKMVVGLEGALGTIHPEYLNFFNDYPEADELIRQDLLAKGELTGAELFAWDLSLGADQRLLSIEGIEDPELYRRHMASYRAVAAESHQVEKMLENFQQKIDLTSQKLLSSELQKFLKERSRRKEGVYSPEVNSFASSRHGNRQFQSYLDYLRKKTLEVLEIDLNDTAEQLRFPNLVRLVALNRAGEKFDVSRAGREWESLSADVRAVLPEPACRVLENAVFARKHHGRILLRTVLEDLAIKSPGLFERLTAENNLWNFLKSQALRSEIRFDELMIEMDGLERAVVERLSADELSRRIISLIDDFSLLKRLMLLQLTSDDWKKIKARGSDFRPTRLAARLGQIDGSSRFEVPGRMKYFYRHAYGFYRLAEARDKALIQNQSDLARRANAEIAVIVSGGFHAEGFSAGLREREVSFATIRPAIRRLGDPAQYHRAMLSLNAEIFPQADRAIASEQVALFLRQISEIGIPAVKNSARLSDAELGALLMAAINAHPVLKDIVEVRLASTPASGSLLVSAPRTQAGVLVHALLKSMLSNSPGNYGLLADPSQQAGVRPASLRFDIRDGKVQLELESAGRAELRVFDNYGYRVDGETALSPEEKRAHRNYAAEAPFIETVRAALEQESPALRESLRDQVEAALRKELQITGKELSDQEFAEELEFRLNDAVVDAFAAKYNRLTPFEVQPPEPGDFTIFESTLGAFREALETASAKDRPRREKTLRGMEQKAAVVSRDEEAANLQTGIELTRQGKLDAVTLSGGLSVRGAIYADRDLYIPGYGKIPLLAAAILNAVKVSRDVSTKIPVTFAESDFTAGRVTQAVRWAVERGFIREEDVNRFIVSLVPRLRFNGGHFRPESSDQGYAVASHLDGLIYYVLSGQYGRAKNAGIEFVKFSNMNVPTSTIDLKALGFLARRRAEADDGKKPGVLIELTENRGETGGYHSRVKYEGVDQPLNQVIEGYVLSPGQKARIAGQKEDPKKGLKAVEPDLEGFPVFNANALLVSMEWIDQFFGLSELGDISPDALRNNGIFKQLLDKVHERISPIGDMHPGEKVPLYIEPKAAFNPETGRKEQVIQIARLLGSAKTVDQNGIALVVPRGTDPKIVPSRYDEAKKKENIVSNRLVWRDHLAPQLPELAETDRPIQEADQLVLRIDALHFAAQTLEPYNPEGEPSLFDQVTDLHNLIIRVLEVQNLTQIDGLNESLEPIDVDLLKALNAGLTTFTKTIEAGKELPQNADFYTEAGVLNKAAVSRVFFAGEERLTIYQNLVRAVQKATDEIQSSRSELRTTVLDEKTAAVLRNTGYRRYGFPFTPEEKRRHRSFASEAASIQAVKENLRASFQGIADEIRRQNLEEVERTQGTQTPVGRMTDEEIAAKAIEAFAYRNNRSTDFEVREPGASDFVTFESVLRAYNVAFMSLSPDSADRNERKATHQGINDKNKMAISESEEAEDRTRGVELAARGKVEVVTLSGGMSVRGGIFADRDIYLPGYGKIPLLAIALLNAIKVARDHRIEKIPSTIAESDFTAPKVSKAIDWLVERGFIRRDDVDRFIVSIIPRIGKDGQDFVPDRPEGYAVASHFDGVRYYLLSGQFGLSRKRGVAYAKFSNMNIPTATINPGILGYFDRQRDTAAEGKKPGVLIEVTENRGETGGFLARVAYRLKDGTERVIRQVIEKFVLTDEEQKRIIGEKKKDPGKIGEKHKFPVFNANTIWVSLDWIYEFFGLEDLGFDPTPGNLDDPVKYQALLAKIDARMNDAGDYDPGVKVPLYLEPKVVSHPVTGEKEPVLQTSRLLGSLFTVDQNGIAFLVPRQTDPAIAMSRYDEAKTKLNIVSNRVNGAWAKYLLFPGHEQLPALPEGELPLKAADLMVARADQLYLDAQKTGGAYADLVTDFHDFIIAELNVRNGDQIREYEGYLTEIEAADSTEEKARIISRLMQRSELREAEPVSPFMTDGMTPTTVLLGRVAEYDVLNPVMPLPDRVAESVVSYAEDHAAGIYSVISITNRYRESGIPEDKAPLFAYTFIAHQISETRRLRPAVTALSAEEKEALGQDFIERFLTPVMDDTAVLAKQFVLPENVSALPKINQDLKLWIRFLASHPNVTWQLDVDNATAEQAQAFLRDVLDKAAEWQLPLRSGQIVVTGSAVPGFDLETLRRTGRNLPRGYLAGRAEYLKRVPVQLNRTLFRRTVGESEHEQTADRLLAAEALTLELKDENIAYIGPASEFARDRGVYQQILNAIIAYSRIEIAA